ncbi:RidA family protein [Streptomyces sp. T1317-0309]|nr:RidA family protein [Streptomyces sp. T1317-0309]
MSEPTRIPAPTGRPRHRLHPCRHGHGRFVAISGQLALDEDGRLVGAGDPAAQARQVFENLRRCLAAAGAAFDHVVKLTFFVTDMAHMPAIRGPRRAHTGRPAAGRLGGAGGGARAPGVPHEIEAYAVVGG